MVAEGYPRCDAPLAVGGRCRAADGCDLLVAVGEACTNAVEHAYGPDGGTVTVHMELQLPDVLATVRDTGRWRPPRGENRENRGRGGLFMRTAATICESIMGLPEPPSSSVAASPSKHLDDLPSGCLATPGRGCGVADSCAISSLTRLP
jgi:Histidine kinase-like ATPase domain